jgi:hypothetical protein
VRTVERGRVGESPAREHGHLPLQEVEQHSLADEIDDAGTAEVVILAVADGVGVECERGERGDSATVRRHDEADDPQIASQSVGTQQAGTLLPPRGHDQAAGGEPLVCLRAEVFRHGTQAEKRVMRPIADEDVEETEVL